MRMPIMGMAMTMLGLRFKGGERQDRGSEASFSRYSTPKRA